MGIELTENAARRLGPAVRWVERQAKNEVGVRRGPKEDIRGPASSGAEIITFEVVDVLRGVGFYCNAMECIVTGVQCGMTSPVVGDTVTVWDGLLCSFQVPFELIVGIQGYAVNMSTDEDYFGDGGLEMDSPCHWEVLRLCCVEESVP